MKKTKQLLLLTALLLTGARAFAALPPGEAEERARELKGRPSGLISEAANRRLTRAQELAAGQQYKPAIDLLKDYIAKGSIRDNEKAQFLQNLGFIEAQKGDYDAAIKDFQQALALNQLPYSPTLATEYALGQMYLAKEKYKDSIEILENWFQLEENPKGEAYAVLATAYSQLGQKQKALGLIETAISKTDHPSENWLIFALALNFEMKKWPKCIELLKHLTAQFPTKAQYWKQLSGVYLNIDKNAEALAALEVAYKQNQLEKESEIINLAALYMDQGIPLKAAQVLTKEMDGGKVAANAKHLEVIADAYLAAREYDKALGFLTRASTSSPDGKVLAKKGQLLLQQEKWAQAAEALHAALKKGRLSAPAQVHMGLGISYFNLQNYKSAMDEFTRAEKLDHDLQAARRWISYVESAQGIRQE
jgi:tetratricopeptide (TPR) repeat protein